MPRVARVKSRSGIYHVMLRGVNRQEIFHDDDDNIKFLSLLKKYKEKADLRIYAWCLMNNHVHLLLKEGNEELAITMKRIGVSFAHYYNWKYQTSGHLFQDRFRSENVEDSRYFLTVIRYIHQNPVKAHIVGRVDEWRWSSCLEYYDKNYSQGDLLDRKVVLKMFSNDRKVAEEKFKVFNEVQTPDECLEEQMPKRRLTDDVARVEISKVLGSHEIAQVKSLPQLQRTEILMKIKKIDGLSQRQAARILGVSVNLVFKAGK